MSDFCRPEDCSCIPGIKCDAKNCIHNDKACHCTAESIEVTSSTACTAQETACGTFRKA